MVSAISRALTSKLFVGLFKIKCVQIQPNSLDEVKQNIEDCILSVTKETQHKIASNMRRGRMPALLSTLDISSTYCKTVSVISIYNTNFKYIEIFFNL
jgi:hypothetical protein